MGLTHRKLTPAMVRAVLEFGRSESGYRGTLRYNTRNALVDRGLLRWGRASRGEDSGDLYVTIHGSLEAQRRREEQRHSA